ncbi:PAN domain-containing protein [Ditylenchus destructor]|nr:PAN domain-containing protein [Ditylenchus destructor]
MLTPSGCELATSSANHSNSEALRPSARSTYLEKFCIPSKLAKNVAKVSNAILGHILVGHVQEVIDARTLLDCQLACLRSETEYGFVCRSAMWYPTDEDQNCLLNSESKSTQPDVFVPEDQGVTMIYFEMAKEDSAIKGSASGAMMRFRDSPLSASSIAELKNRMFGMGTSKWTRWSLCKKESANSMRHRYLKCTDKKDVRKCPKESVMCKNLPPLPIQRINKATFSQRNQMDASNGFNRAPQGECRAVRDAFDRKHCPYGMRVDVSTGRREYCAKPVDC